jgi:ABC-type Fe3+-hydroxamate transport system substrate-binding protein
MLCLGGRNRLHKPGRLARFDSDLWQLYHPRAMGQPRILGLAALAAAALAAAVIASRKNAPLPPFTGAEPRVASITPAGTDLLIGMGGGDHLVGVSNFDHDREGTIGKPRIGDYQSVDWERLATLRPQILLVQYAGDRIPSGLQQRCADLGIRIVNLKLNPLADIFSQTQMLADAVGESQKGRAAVARLREQLERIRARVAGLPAVSAVIATHEGGLDLAGPGEFLDDLLAIAGGTNAAAGTGQPYPTVDRELLVRMSPQAVIQLIPDGDKAPQLVAQSKRFWDSLANLPAVRNHRVAIVTDWYCLEPGLRVGDLGEEFARILHPQIGDFTPSGIRP